MENIIVKYKELGIRIKGKRISKNMSQSELAELTGLSTQHISNIETGRSKVSLDKLMSIVNVLECSVSELLCDSMLPQQSRPSFSEEVEDFLSTLSDAEIKLLPRFLENYKDMFAEIEKEVNCMKNIDSIKRTEDGTN